MFYLKSLLWWFHYLCMPFFRCGVKSIPQSEGSTTSGFSDAVQVRERHGRPGRRAPSPPPPIYKDQSKRLESFQAVSWQQHLAATPDKLAKAGFYYIGPSDRVKCGYCGGKLKNWQPTDSAVEEHVKHFPDCSFVKTFKIQIVVLSKNIRTKAKKDSCKPSKELMIEAAEERAKSKQSTPGRKKVFITLIATFCRVALLENQPL